MGAKSEEVFGDVWMGWGECGRSQRFVNGGSEESLDGCSVERGKG